MRTSDDNDDFTTTVDNNSFDFKTFYDRYEFIIFIYSVTNKYCVQQTLLFTQKFLKFYETRNFTLVLFESP